MQSNYHIYAATLVDFILGVSFEQLNDQDKVTPPDPIDPSVSFEQIITQDTVTPPDPIDSSVSFEQLNDQDKVTPPDPIDPSVSFEQIITQDTVTPPDPIDSSVSFEQLNDQDKVSPPDPIDPSVSFEQLYTQDTVTPAAPIDSKTQEDCGHNQEYNECGTICPITCSNYNDPGVCAEVCEAGCFCKEGFYQDARGICVEKAKCDFCCGNTTYASYGSMCETTCMNVKFHLHIGIVCPKESESGCVCKDGYARLNDEPACVLYEDCPQ
ncbi:uncharacterized protein LOC134965863 isoform X2 [Pseudophryne corroboree]|uniref:uncharacterized protein LOC134965863 isoform X2 n=1 Tax=Pseudophryne corroboree TaxID=495146 RepID=UPI0030820133